MSSSISSSKLFQPIKVGNLTLSHRVVLAPLTRSRATIQHVHGDLALEYYTQRSSVPGTLLVAEATPVTAKAGGWPHIPGISTEEQISAWKKIVDAVHANGSYIYLQLWAMGRAARPEILEAGFEIIGPSPIPLPGRPTPRELTVDEIHEYVDLYRQAATNAVEKAGFDGVEVHSLNGYLLDQFLQDTSNARTDNYGGSIENRTRFTLEALGAVVGAVGPERAALRLSPWSSFQGMRMKDPIPTFSYLINQIKERHPNLSYLHVTEPGVGGASYLDTKETDSNDFIRDIWLPRPLITAGGYDAISAARAADKTGELIAFGRFWISNPDLPARLKSSIPLTAFDPNTYYTPESPVGYIDYPFRSIEA